MFKKELKMADSKEKVKKYGWAKEEIDIIMAEMRRHLGENKPEVGTFFYDIEKKKLILTDTISTELARDLGNGIKTTEKLHEEVWLENDMEGNYMNIPRGRVFYDSKNNEYEIMVGDLLNKVSNIKESVVKRFHLENQKVVILTNISNEKINKEKIDPNFRKEIESIIKEHKSEFDRLK